MSTWHHCWRCETRVPMLDAAEWSQIEPLMRGTVQDIKDYRERTGASVYEALEKNKNTAAQRKYSALTGYDEPDVNAIWHHRLDLYGGPCQQCGELLRTPKARYCASCGRVAA
jgi:hypothetical protein